MTRLPLIHSRPAVTPGAVVCMSESWAAQEFAGATIWDGRCRRSLVRICLALERHHGRSFSAACGTPGRQAPSRIFGHARLTVAGLLKGHQEQTAARAQQVPAGERVLV